MKLWRLNAQAHNIERARIIDSNIGVPRDQRQEVPPSARILARQQEYVARALKGKIAYSNWLLAGLMNNLDWQQVALTLIDHRLLSHRQLVAFSKGAHPQAVL